MCHFGCPSPNQTPKKPTECGADFQTLTSEQWEKFLCVCPHMQFLTTPQFVSTNSISMCKLRTVLPVGLAPQPLLVDFTVWRQIIQTLMNEQTFFFLLLATSISWACSVFRAAAVSGVKRLNQVWPIFCQQHLLFCTFSMSLARKEGWHFAVPKKENKQT